MPDDNVSAATIVYFDYDPFFGPLVCNDTNDHYATNTIHDAYMYDTYVDDQYHDIRPLEDSGPRYAKLSAAESALFFIFFLLIITGNLTVMIWRCRKRRAEERNSIPSLLVINLAAADLLLGIQLVIFLYLHSWSCSVLGSRNDVKLMTSLCYISGVMESTSVLLSGMITGTIAFYYANVVFGKRCCCCVTRRCVIIFLSIGWIVALGLGVGATLFSGYEQFSENRSIAPFYIVTPQPIYVQGNSTDDLISTNATISTVLFQSCVPITSFLSDMGTVSSFQHKNRTKLPSLAETITGCVFGIDLLLVGTAAGIYITIAHKLRRSKALAVSNHVGGLGFRLIAIAFVTLFGWVAFVIMFFVTGATYFEHLLPLAIVALCNPLTFTLASAPFCKTVKNLKRRTLFKLNRPVLIEDITDDEERLIATQSPSDGSTKDLPSLA